MDSQLIIYGGWIIFGLLSLIAILATLLPLSSSKQWYIRVFDYPRLQVFFMAGIALIWYWVFYYQQNITGHFFAGLLVMVLFIHAYKAFPYTVFGKKQVKDADKATRNGKTLSILISNVLQDNREYEKLINKIQKYAPDLVITTETDKRWEHALSVLDKNYPFNVSIPQDNKYGMHLFSRLELVDPIKRYLLEEDIPSIRTKIKLRNQELITLFIIHPKPPFPGEDDDTEERDAEIILVGQEAREESEGVIVAGDFNDVAWSDTTKKFQKRSGLLDPRRGRGFFNTYHAGYPVFRWPLDHIFHSSHFSLVKIKRLGKIGSDHFPMYIELAYVNQDGKET